MFNQTLGIKMTYEEFKRDMIWLLYKVYSFDSNNSVDIIRSKEAIAILKAKHPEYVLMFNSESKDNISDFSEI